MTNPTPYPVDPPDAARLEALERDGVIVLPDLLDAAALGQIQAAFRAHLRHMRWNTTWGYTNEDNYRHMVGDVLALDREVVRLVLHPRLLGLMSAYLGPSYVVTEAKGWRSLPTRRDFHVWHTDAWYDPALPGVPRQLKLAVYLSDVHTGAFAYLKGSHLRQGPGHWTDATLPGRAEDVVTLTGPAGTCIVFDSSGIHRQSYPILSDRDALFIVYNDPAIPLQAEDIAAYRYHPPLVAPAFLGGLSGEQLRALGVGAEQYIQAAHVPPPRHPRFERAVPRLSEGLVVAERVRGRLEGAARKVLVKRGR